MVVTFPSSIGSFVPAVSGGGREEGRKGGREEGRKGGREEGREGGRKGGREEGKEGEREGGRECILKHTACTIADSYKGQFLHDSSDCNILNFWLFPYNKTSRNMINQQIIHHYILLICLLFLSPMSPLTPMPPFTSLSTSHVM